MTAVARRLGSAAGAAMAVALIVVLAAILAPWVAPYPPSAITDLAASATPPSMAHLMGTDLASRDVFSRLLHGARVTLAVAAVAVLVSTLIGVTYGTIAAMAGGWVDALMMRAVDALMAIPRILLLVALAAVAPQRSAMTLAVLIGVTGWLVLARLVRAQAMALQQAGFVDSARALGATPRDIILRHLAPHLAGTVLVSATLGIAGVIGLEAALSYLGLGLPQPAPSWGSMIREGMAAFGSAWWLLVFPTLAILSVTLAFNVLGDALRRRPYAGQLPGSRSR
jgi:peptide/nickel transport system permease protein